MSSGRQSASGDSSTADSPIRLAVFGAARCGPELDQLAFAVGREVARRGALLLCGGRDGVMAAAARGARAGNGRTVGILPGADRSESPPNPHIELPIYTGMGQARNQILALSASAAIAVGGGWGTLSEIALALKQGVPVVSLRSWSPRRPDGRPEPLLLQAGSAEEAVDRALAAAREAAR